MSRQSTPENFIISSTHGGIPVCIRDLSHRPAGDSPPDFAGGELLTGGLQLARAQRRLTLMDDVRAGTAMLAVIPPGGLTAALSRTVSRTVSDAPAPSRTVPERIRLRFGVVSRQRKSPAVAGLSRWALLGSNQ